MLGSGWLTARQVKAALKNGRLDDAQQLLSQPSFRGHRKSWELLASLRRSFLSRSVQYWSQGQLPLAWADLQRAESLDPADPEARQLRDRLTHQSVAELRGLLESGDPDRAVELLARLGQYGVAETHLRPLEDSVKDWLLARDLADRGEFLLAKQMFERVRRSVPHSAGATRFEVELNRRFERFQIDLPHLHEAVDENRWRDVLTLADQVLTVAPQHGEAKKARARAWKSHDHGLADTGQAAPLDQTQADDTQGPAKRFLLWIDGVGGYLLCLGQRIRFGAAGEGNVEVPLLADVSRLHATLSRDGEGYVIESSRPMLINDVQASKAVLKSGDRVTLGKACQFMFQVPVPVSTTARLLLVSGHRLPLSVDGILLMSETMLLGAGPQVHVAIPELESNIVLYRTKDGIGIRHAGEFRVNGELKRDREPLPANAKVSGKDFSLAVEPAGSWGR